MTRRDEFDACVIGTGARGGVMVDRLTAAGLRARKPAWLRAFRVIGAARFGELATSEDRVSGRSSHSRPPEPHSTGAAPVHFDTLRYTSIHTDWALLTSVHFDTLLLTL